MKAIRKTEFVRVRNALAALGKGGGKFAICHLRFAIPFPISAPTLQRFNAPTLRLIPRHGPALSSLVKPGKAKNFYFDVQPFKIRPCNFVTLATPPIHSSINPLIPG